MKKGSLLNLVYRDLYISRKPLLIAAMSLIAISVVSVLVIVSMDCGNLKMLIMELMLREVPDAESILEAIKANVAFVIKAFPIMCAGFMAVTFAEGTANDEKRVWKDFYRSSPLNYWKKSFVKIFAIFALELLGFAVGIGYSAIVTAVSGIDMITADYGLLMLGFAIGIVLSVLFLIFIMLFHSLDKAGLMLVATIAVPVIGIQVYNAFKDTTHKAVSTEEIIENVRGFCEDFLPFTFIIIAGVIVIGFFVTAMIYKRREK